MISLGSISLDANLDLIDIESKVLASSTHVTFGKPIVQVCRSYGGNEIFLEASVTGDTVYGYFTTSQIREIENLRDSGQPVILKHYLKTYNIFLPPDALSEIRQHIPIVDPDTCPDSTFYVGRLKMIII